MGESVDERQQRLIAAEMQCSPRWHYLSFADDTGFLGACIVVGYGVITAIQRAHELGINPGGNVACVAIDDKDVGRFTYDQCNRLLTKAEALALDV